MRIALLLLPGLFACTPKADDGIPVLGSGMHDIGSVTLTVVGTAGADQLANPRDLAFHPTETNQLWIVNQRSQSTTIISDVALAGQSSILKRNTESGTHFHARPSSLAMGIDTFATIHDTDQLTQGPGGSPGEFMGPTLWPTDVDDFDAGHSSHLDMLHNSPLGKGIAWEVANTFWVFDGYHNALTRYAFHGDHGPGGSDHTDGVIKRYAEGQVSMENNVPSHIELDAGILYIADTGNSRVAMLMIDELDGSGSPTTPNYDGARQEAIDTATVETLSDEGLDRPTGIAVLDGVVYVSDAGTGTISAFDAQGVLLDWLKVGGTPNGLEFHQDGSLYYIDNDREEVIRIQAL